MKINNFSNREIETKIRLFNPLNMVTDIQHIFKWIYDKIVGIEESQSQINDNFIPLTGTEVGKPVEGVIDIGINGRNGFCYGKIKVDENTETLFITNETGTQGVSHWGFFTFDEEGHNIYRGMEGLVAEEDFSDLSIENKLVYAQRSYAEKPETLINALNNCDETQLGVIKGILGIV